LKQHQFSFVSSRQSCIALDPRFPSAKLGTSKTAENAGLAEQGYYVGTRRWDSAAAMNHHVFTAVGQAAARGISADSQVVIFVGDVAMTGIV